MDKIYTFQINFSANKTEDVIQFCAETREEAESLFEYWCTEDEKAEKTYSVSSIEVVYNDEDAKCYGDLYGTPEEYSLKGVA